LGVGVGGGDRHELEIGGVDPSTRGRRLDECLTIVRALLAGETVDFSGRVFRVEQARIVPIPSGTVPIVVGGRSAAALRRAGRLGDGWLGIWVSPARYGAAVEEVAAEAEATGRGAVDWNHGLSLWCGFGADRAATRERLAAAMEGLYRTPFDAFERWCPYGTPEAVAEAVAPYLDAGCTTVHLVPVTESTGAAVAAVAEVRARLGLPVSA